MTLWKELKTFRLNKDAYTKILVLSKMKHVRYIGTCTLNQNDNEQYMLANQWFKRYYKGEDNPNKIKHWVLSRDRFFADSPTLINDSVSLRSTSNSVVYGYNMFYCDTPYDSYPVGQAQKVLYLPKEQSFFWDKRTGKFYTMYFFDYEKAPDDVFFCPIALISFRELSSLEIKDLRKEKKLYAPFQKFKYNHISDKVYMKRVEIIYQNGVKISHKVKSYNSPRALNPVPMYDVYNFFKPNFKKDNKINNEIASLKQIQNVRLDTSVATIMLHDAGIVDGDSVAVLIDGVFIKKITFTKKYEKIEIPLSGERRVISFEIISEGTNTPCTIDGYIKENKQTINLKGHKGMKVGLVIN